MEWLLDVLWIFDDDWWLNLEPPWGSVVFVIYGFTAFWLFAAVFWIFKTAYFGNPHTGQGGDGFGIIENWAGIMRTGTFVLVLLITLKVYGCIGG